MKTILLIMALIGFTTVSSYAQDKNCTCKKKTAYHSTHHRKATALKKTAVVVERPVPTDVSLYLLGIGNSQPDMAINNLPANRCAIDSNGDIEYTSDNTYLGYYSENHANCDPFDQLVLPYTDLAITSTAFTNGGVMPAKYTCEGEGASPPMNITNIPAGTVSLAIVMFDPHSTANKSTTYWLMWDLDTSGIVPENFINDHSSQNPINKQYGYQPVCPVAGTHNYHFRVYALDTKLLLSKKATQATVENAMRGHILAKGELIGQYNRHLD